LLEGANKNYIMAKCSTLQMAADNADEGKTIASVDAFPVL